MIFTALCLRHPFLDVPNGSWLLCDGVHNSTVHVFRVCVSMFVLLFFFFIFFEWHGKAYIHSVRVCVWLYGACTASERATSRTPTNQPAKQLSARIQCRHSTKRKIVVGQGKPEANFIVLMAIRKYVHSVWERERDRELCLVLACGRLAGVRWSHLYLHCLFACLFASCSAAHMVMVKTRARVSHCVFVLLSNV